MDANQSTTCGLNENLDGSHSNNQPFEEKMTDAQKEGVEELKDMRSEVPDITPDTVMQKALSPSDFEKYMDEDSPKTQVTGCAARAEDAAPYTSNARETYDNLRLDYQGTEFKEPAENNGDTYVMRFQSDYCPSNDEFPKMDDSQPWNKPPCTGTGYVGSEDHLIPEYSYGRGQDISDGAIYKIDSDGNETMVAYWNHGRFQSVE